MNRDDILRMAREAGLTYLYEEKRPSFDRLVALVAAAEREACAKVCEEYAQAKYAAIAIRERSKE